MALNLRQVVAVLRLTKTIPDWVTLTPVVFSTRGSKRVFVALASQDSALAQGELPASWVQGGFYAVLPLAQADVLEHRPFTPDLFSAVDVSDSDSVTLGDLAVLASYQVGKKTVTRVVSYVTLCFDQDDAPYFHFVLGSEM